MIKQAAIGLNSRSEANPYNEYGFLPLITAPMYSVVDETNYQVFLDNKIQVCLPRNTKVEDIGDFDNVFFALSLEEFITNYIEAADHSSFNLDNEPNKICIDTANGNIPALHDAIRKAKEIHGDELIIMTGNVASTEAFVELARTGVDYIRVGIGGGGGCNTTSNTGVGQENLKYLISDCKWWQEESERWIKEYKNKNKDIPENHTNISKVKIVADGISSWIKFCEKEYGYNDNGYAAINELLFAGADLVMVGKLFAQCVESAGEKRIYTKDSRGYRYDTIEDFRGLLGIPGANYADFINDSVDPLVVKYAGMSTHQEQKKYKSEFYWKWWWGDSILGTVKDETVFYDFDEMKTYSSKHSFENSITQQNYYSNYTKHKNTKPSEGSVQWIPVRWTLDEWLNGSNKQDEAPYLMGWINSIKSAMAYTGKTTL